jgi:UDP-N-acetylbacillosamine N-acetyltransferase
MAMQLLVWGASGHAAVVADILRLSGHYEIAGFLDDTTSGSSGEFCGAPVLGGREQLDSMRSKGLAELIVAIGDCAARVKLAEVARQKGFTLATAIHPRATIAASATVGAGTVIAAGAVVNPGAVIGENVIINTAATIDHDCVVEDGAHIGPGCHLGGHVRAIALVLFPYINPVYKSIRWVYAGLTKRPH